MSKKLSEGIDGLVLDVKVGVGAFMKTIEDARDLAETMVGLGASHGTRCVAVFTAMDEPLGRKVGNALEIDESIDVLEGRGPADLTEVVYRLGTEMLVLGGLAGDHDAAADLMTDAVASGRAMETFGAVIETQGGNPAVLTDRSLLPRARHVSRVRAERSGYVGACNALDVGVAIVRLGGGRERKEDAIDPGVGVTLLKKHGDRVAEGEPLAEVAYNDRARLERALPLLERAWAIHEEPPAPLALVLGQVRHAPQG
jgi:pyrimidine-nucleoside phosphorylase